MCCVSCARERLSRPCLAAAQPGLGLSDPHLHGDPETSMLMSMLRVPGDRHLHRDPQSPHQPRSRASRRAAPAGAFGLHRGPVNSGLGGSSQRPLGPLAGPDEAASGGLAKSWSSSAALSALPVQPALACRRRPPPSCGWAALACRRCPGSSTASLSASSAITCSMCTCMSCRPVGPSPPLLIKTRKCRAAGVTRMCRRPSAADLSGRSGLGAPNPCGLNTTGPAAHQARPRRQGPAGRPPCGPPGTRGARDSDGHHGWSRAPPRSPA